MKANLNEKPTTEQEQLRVELGLSKRARMNLCPLPATVAPTTLNGQDAPHETRVVQQIGKRQKANLVEVGGDNDAHEWVFEPSLIRKARWESGVKLLDFTASTGIAPSQLMNYENGKFNPTATSLAKVASGLRVSVAYFFRVR